MPVDRLRLLVLAATAFVAFNMYLDRACLSQVSAGVKTDLKLEAWQWDLVLSAFFWSYGFAQVPAAALGKRYGYRLVLTVYLLLWTWYTGVTGLAWAFAGLLAARLMVGVSEAGAYPTAAALVRNWFPLSLRGRASSAVALGGRAGFVFALFLTNELAVEFGWRVTLLCFTALGFVAAAVFWVVARDSPAVHPWNSSPVESEPPTPAGNATSLPISALLASRNAALASLNQFGINVGWAFLITKMFDYFREFLLVPKEDLKWLNAFPVLVGCIGMFCGGMVTDLLTRRFGVRTGRRIPLGVLPLIAAGAYFAISTTRDPWTAAALIGLMALAVDCANPAYWAFSQDVGRTHAAAALAWGNMFGQIGAGLSPLAFGAVQRSYGWPAAFQMGAAAFALAGVAGFLLNASRPIEVGNRDTTEE